MRLTPPTLPLQWQQAITATAAVAAVMGAVPVLLSFVTAGRMRRGVPPTVVDWIDGALLTQAYYSGWIIACIVLFALLPMTLLHGGVRLLRRWTGRD